ncbi:hypothetical protein EDC96DRAFT_436499 [Choanephora cucurbitarum]|nr:hypothetical protein EDC96DRAFT_436499 [Choanephora cucurbitarum]
MLNNSIIQYSPTTKDLPKINVMLDLPHSDGYVPTYWPGQSISGQLNMKLPTAIKVTHLRITLFGNVQVHGDLPELPVSNGLFDYHQNQQLVNTGLRVMKKTTTNQQDEQGEQTADNCMERESGDAQQSSEISRNQFDTMPIYDSNDHTLILDNGRADHHFNLTIKPKKSSEDRHIESLIKKIATAENFSNQCHGILINPEANGLQNSVGQNTYDLSASTHQIAFSIQIPTTRKLPGTFSHPNYPITYRVIAIMRCFRQTETGEQVDTVVYHTIRVRLEAVNDVNSGSLGSPIQILPAYQCVRNNGSFKNRICTYFLSSSSVLTDWACKSLSYHQQYQNSERISRNKPCYSSYLQLCPNLPRQAFKRSQEIPLVLLLKNYAISHFKISTVQVFVQLVRRINMTCSVNEEVESIVLQSYTAVVHCSQQPASHSFFKNSSIHLDLSQITKVPNDCVCTTPPSVTKDIFEISYSLKVKLSVLGASFKQESNLRRNSISVGPATEDLYIAVSKQHIASYDEVHPTVDSVEGHKQKCYNIYVKPIPIVIGNVD